MKGCRDCCYAAPTGANLYCSINDCYVGELTCDDFEPIVKAKTNYDRIVSKGPEEMAAWIADHSVVSEYDENNPKHKAWRDWLKQEAKE